MSANIDAAMTQGQAEPGLATPAACLAAAQSEAERLFGDGPVSPWRSSLRWRRWAAGAAAALLSGVGWWGWDGAAPAGVPAALVAAAPSPPLAVAPAPAAERPAVVAAAALDRAHCVGVACRMRPSQIDPDGWALHPEPEEGAGVALPAFTGLVNTPDIPDENDTTPGEETSAEEEQAPVAIE